ncbi:MAG: hypothetical protein ACRBN8_38660 [Nannocystales bacterium]
MTKKRIGRQCALALAVAILGSACGTFDEPEGETDSGGAGGDSTGQDNQNDGPGVWLDCGYHLIDTNFPTASGVAYPHPRTMCVDPASPQFDGNGDGSLNLEEMIGACELKCPNGPGGYPFDGPGLSGSWDAFAPTDVHPPFNGCFAVEARVDQDEGACDPSSPVHSEPWPTTLTPPTHEGTFTSDQTGSHATVNVNGVPQSLEFAGDVAFSVYDCEERGRQQACLLDLQHLAITLGSVPVFGEYEVSFAQLSFNRTTTAPVSFACDASGCSGSFEFLARSGTTIAADLNFEQKHLSTGTPGGGYIGLGADGLGQFTRVIGELDLDTTKSTGTLWLRGEGKDAMGGEFASTTFDLTSAVSRPSL